MYRVPQAASSNRLRGVILYLFWINPPRSIRDKNVFYRDTFSFLLAFGQIFSNFRMTKRKIHLGRIENDNQFFR